MLAGVWAEADMCLPGVYLAWRELGAGLAALPTPGNPEKAALMRP